MPREKQNLLTAAQCRAVDQYAITRLGIPGLVLMENAGRNAADLIQRWTERPMKDKRRSDPHISILCGKGNNGGDGFVIARHLAIRGLDVSVDLTGEPAGLSPDAAVNYAIVRKMGLPARRVKGGQLLVEAAQRWQRSTVIVDALLGTGFAGEVREPLAGVIRQINGLKAPLIVAIDLPSGLNADTGRPGGVAVRADQTITFLARKAGFAIPEASLYVGRVTVVDIGAPLSLILEHLQA